MLQDSQISKSVNHKYIIEGFYNRFHDGVMYQAFEVLGVSRQTLLARCRRWLLGPFLFTLEGRGNFFRAGLSVAMGEGIRQPKVGWIVATTGEIAWTCALLADDLLDGSSEREGHTCAHVVYGRVHTFLALNFALWRVFLALVIRTPLPITGRIRLVVLSIRLLVLCVSSQLPIIGSARNLAGFYKHAERVNNSNHWALVGPLMGVNDRELVAAAWDYATAIAINGKMQNDLLDYCGGSTESQTLYRDFNRRYVTFPILILLEQNLSERDRGLIKDYFFKRANGAFTLEDLNDLFRRHQILEQCLELMKNRARDAVRAVDRLEEKIQVPDDVSRILLTWARDAVDWAEERIQAWRGSHG